MIDPLIATRGIHFAATVLTAGTVGFVVLVAERAAHGCKLDLSALQRRYNAMILIGLAVAIASGVGWLALLAADILSTPVIDVWLHGGAWSVLSETRFGWVWTARLVIAVVLAVLLRFPRTGWLRLVAAVMFIAALALIGHAGSTPGTAGDIHLVSDIVHLVAAGAWLGGLPALAILLEHTRERSRAPWRDFAIRATRRFSILGIASVGALLTSGLINSWNLLSGPRDLIVTDYGRLLALKIGLFAAMIAFAAVNRFHLTPRLPTSAAMRSLQRNSLAETALGLCALLLVGALGAMEPSNHTHAALGGVPADAAFTHIHTSQAMADVTIDPGRAGRVNATIRVLREDFSEFPAKAVRLTLDPPTANLQQIARNAARMADGSWQVDALELPQAGVWTVRVIVNGDSGAPVVLDAPIAIDRR